MAEEPSPSRASKRERREVRKREATGRRRRRTLRRGLLVAALLAVPGAWLLDWSAPEEVVQAEVIRTSLWRHRPATGQPHTHTRATLLIEGLNEVNLSRADGLDRGQRVPVYVRRGRFTGWPYFSERVPPGVEISPGVVDSDATEGSDPTPPEPVEDESPETAPAPTEPAPVESQEENG